MGVCVKDVTCPYCSHQFDICHDDGHGYDESRRHEDTCPKCEKNFVFTSYISVTHTAYKADCLNGEPHKLDLSRTYPPQFRMMRCRDCDYERKPTELESA